MPTEVVYSLGEGAPDGVEIISLSLLEIETTPVKTDICNRGITYIVLYDDTEVTTSTSPVRRASSSLRRRLQSGERIELLLFTEDAADVGDHVISVKAQQTGPIIPDDPAFSTVFADFTTIRIEGDPCDGSVEVDATP